jgi:hypothetical protein
VISSISFLFCNMIIMIISLHLVCLIFFQTSVREIWNLSLEIYECIL